MTVPPSEEVKAAWRYSRNAALYDARCRIEAHLALQTHEVSEDGLDENVLAYCDGLREALRIINRIKDQSA